MSVLIRGMEMPENCYECPFGLLEYISQYYGKTIHNKFACCITHKAKTSTKRNRFCPLVEVPTPHGRLVDADALMDGWMHLRDAVKYGNKNAEQQRHSYSTMMMYEIANEIDDAPTIIEAEGES